MAEIIDYAERLTRAAVSRASRRQCSAFEDWIDDDGIDINKPIRLFVTMHEEGRLA